MKPITHELAYIYITGDSKFFFDKDKAERHQRKITIKEKRKK